MTHPSKIGHNRDGFYRKNVKTMTTGTTARYDITVEESGTFFVCKTVSTASFGLPKISSKWLGLTYEFYFSTADADGDYTIQCPFDSSAGIYIAHTTAGVGTPSTITPGSTDVPHAIRVTAISSVVWLGEPLMIVGASTHASTAKSSALGAWTTG